MIVINNNPYLTLHEFIREEELSFPLFAQAPDFACEEEKILAQDVIKINNAKPGYIKYMCNEVNANYINQLREVINKRPVTQKSNRRIYDIITMVTKNLGIHMPLIYMYSDSDVYDFNNNSENEILLPDNAFTMGTKDMLYVFVSDSLVETNNLTDEETAALIGHEIGHAISNHLVYTQVFKMKIIKNTMTASLVKWDNIDKLYQSNFFSRINEFTADRAALLACRSFSAVENLLKKISPDAMWDYDHSNASHPNGKTRVKAVELFYSSILYNQCMDSIDGFAHEKLANTLSKEQLYEQMKKLYLLTC